LKKGIGPVGLLLIGLFGSLIVSGLTFLALYSRTNVSKRAMMEINVIDGVNKVELSKIGLSKALKYSFYEASYLTSSRGGYYTLEGEDSYNCIPYWREYSYTGGYPGTSYTGRLMLEAFEDYIQETNNEINIPGFDYFEIQSLDDSEVKVRVSSDQGLVLDRGKLNIKEDSLENILDTNIVQMYNLGKERFIDMDGIRNAIEISINDMPSDSLSVQIGDVCENELDARNELLSRYPNWEEELRNRIINNIEGTITVGNLEITTSIPDYMSDIAVSFEPYCSWDESNVIEDDATHCDCARMYDVDCGGLGRDELECHTIDHCRSCYITTSYYTGCYCEDNECIDMVELCEGCEISYDVECGGGTTTETECDMLDHCKKCYTSTPFADYYNGCYCENYDCSSGITRCQGCERMYSVDCGGGTTTETECELLDHCQTCHQTTPYPDTYTGCYCENDDCADEIELCSGCEEHYDYLQDVTCTFDYYASARVLVTIRDTSGRLYPVLEENGNVAYRPIILNFYVVSGNRNLLDPVTDTDDCEVQIVDLPEIGRPPGHSSPPGHPTPGDITICPDVDLTDYIDDYNLYKDTIYEAIENENLGVYTSGNDKAARLVAAIITQESGWNQELCSPSRGCGIMQITQGTASGCEGGWEAIRDDVYANIECGVGILKSKLKSMESFNEYDAENLIKLGLAAYNGGQGTIQEAINIAGDSSWESINNMDIMTQACERICQQTRDTTRTYCGIESEKSGIILTYVDDTVYPYYQSWLDCESETTYSGQLIWPVPVEKMVKISACYGFYPKGGPHYGVDMSVNAGTEIYAAASGVVVEVVNSDSSNSAYNRGFGNAVRLEHTREDGSNFQTFYGHFKCSGVEVVEGQTINQGQLLGYSGGTDACKGTSTGGHLHFHLGHPYTTEATEDPCPYFVDGSPCDADTPCQAT